MGIGITLLFILFVFAAIILIVVILLQEGKGGGFGQALGEHGQATFGVGTSGITNFTAAVAVVFLVSALGIHVLTRQQSSGSLLQDDISAPGIEAGSEAAEGGAPGTAVPTIPGSSAPEASGSTKQGK